MPDVVRAAEFAAKAVRGGFALLGAIADACIPDLVDAYRELYQSADGLAEREAEEDVAEAAVGEFCFGYNQALPLPLCGGFSAETPVAMQGAGQGDSAGVSVPKPAPPAEPLGVVIPPTVTRVVLVHGKHPERTVTEKWATEWDVHIQDDGRTLKLFPKKSTGPRYECTPGFFGAPMPPASAVGPKSPKWLRDLIESTEDCVGVPRGMFDSPLQSADLAEPDPFDAFRDAQPLTWMGWALPAILDVLAEHNAYDYAGGVECPHHLDFPVSLTDWQSWREHVAPIIADRIGCDPARAAAALAQYVPKK